MLRGMRGQRHSERERHPNGEGPGGVGQGGEAGTCPDPGQRRGPDIDPPPGVPIQQAWIAGRIGIGFIGDSGNPTGPNIPFGGDGDPGRQLARLSLESLEALDVEERPFIWDL